MRTRNTISQNSTLLHLISSAGKASDSPQLCLGFPAPTINSQGSRVVGGSPESIACAEQLQHNGFFFLFSSLTLCSVERAEENPCW